MTEPTCSSCRFVDVAMMDDVDLGEGPHLACRRYPPMMVALGDAAGPVLPVVHDSDWCGEYRAAAGHGEVRPPRTPQPNPSRVEGGRAGWLFRWANRRRRTPG